MNKNTTVFYDVYSYHQLPFYLASVDDKIITVTLGNENLDDLTKWVHRYYPSANIKKDPSPLSELAHQLDEYFSQSRQTFDIPILMHGTPFQTRVWEALRTISYGETVSYEEVAIRMGRSNGFRAVGAAIGANPIGIVVPCHRVVGKSGHLTGFGGGLELKRELLQNEGVALEENRMMMSKQKKNEIGT